MSDSSVMPETPETIDNAKPNSASEQQNPAKKFAKILIALIFILIFWYVLSDRYAPYSNQGAVSGYVTQLSAQVSGQVTEVFVEDGDIVDAYTPLFQLDNRAYQLSVSQAKTNLARAMQATEASAASILSSQAQVSEARTVLDNTRSATNRALVLAKRNLISTAEADNARARLKSAQASYDRAAANLDAAMLSLGVSGSENIEVKAAQLNLEQALLKLDYTTVRAPTRGVVTNLQLAIGQYVAPGAPAITFIDGRGAWITLDLRENQLGNINEGDKCHLLFDAVPGKIFTGTVTSMAWGIDTGRRNPNGLMQNQTSTQWVEPARRIPVYIQLEGGTDNWPMSVRAGGKVSAVIYAKGRRNPIAWVSTLLIHIRSYLSYLY